MGMKSFSRPQIKIVNQSVSLAEELVCNFFKMSATQWLRHRYDVKTSAELSSHEKVDGPFAQLVRYSAQKEGDSLCSSSYDLYKICLQDQAVLAAIEKYPEIKLFPFVVYIIVHELIHIVRFAKFYQNFDALPEERTSEEDRVHGMTREILSGHGIEGMPEVMRFYSQWEAASQELF